MSTPPSEASVEADLTRLDNKVVAIATDKAYELFGGPVSTPRTEKVMKALIALGWLDENAIATYMEGLPS